MLSLGKCEKCGEYDFLDGHRCKPIWDVVCDGYNDIDSPIKSFGFDAETAAITFAEQNFSNLDYPDEMEIWIKRPEDVEWQKFNIEARPEPVFYATLIKETPQSSSSCWQVGQKDNGL